MKRFFGSIMGSSLLWGGLLSIGYYAAIRRGVVSNELLVRYTAGHPVEYITVIMFFIGMASLALKWFSLYRERRALTLGPVFPVIKEKEDVARSVEYLKTLEKAKLVRGSSRYIGRLTSLMTSLSLNGSVEDLDQELRYQSDEDQVRSAADYGMVRMFIWAIPILGFLGTVVGITMALGNLNLTELETTGKLLAEGLQVAFDTTALALSLVFVLYFSLFFVQGRETQYFRTLDHMVEQEIRGRFFSREKEEENTPAVLVQRTMRAVVDSFDDLMKRQTVLWSEAIDRVSERSAQVASEGIRQAETVFGTTLRNSVREYIEQFRNEQKSFVLESLTPLIAAMEKKTEKLGSFKDQMAEETRLLLEVVRATGEVTRLEDRLNHNLATLANVGCFEETVNSLAATIHLLNTKLTGMANLRPEIRLAASPEMPVAELSPTVDDVVKVLPMKQKNHDSSPK